MSSEINQESEFQEYPINLDDLNKSFGDYYRGGGHFWKWKSYENRLHIEDDKPADCEEPYFNDPACGMCRACRYQPKYSPTDISELTSYFVVGLVIDVVYGEYTKELPSNVKNLFKIVHTGYESEETTYQWTYKGFTDTDKVWDEKKYGSIGENTLFSAFLLGLQRLESLSHPVVIIRRLDTLQLLENVTFNMIHLI